MPLRFPLAMLAACAAIALAGCEPNQLYMTSHTVIGVNGAVDPQQTSGWLVVGYDRTFATVIPRSAPNTDPNTDPNAKDAMSSMACSRLIVNGIMIQRFQESIATGHAAETFANNIQTAQVSAEDRKKAVKDFFACFKDTGNGS